MLAEYNVAFIPAGEMNSALALKAAGNGHKVVLYLHSQESYEYFQASNESPKLKGVKLPGVKGTNCLAEALSDRNVVCFTPRSWDLRTYLRDSTSFIDPNAIIVFGTKGFDEYQGRYYTPSQVAEQELPDFKDRFVVLSGPNFARQIALGKITGTTIAAYNLEYAKRVRGLFQNGSFRADLYGGRLLDVEIIGAAKNVIGLVMGFARTLKEYDENTGAFILQKGLYEVSLLCEAMGGDPKAIMQLCGVGDSGLLMNSMTSRNVEAGYDFGRGAKTIEDLTNPKHTIEGVRTVKAVRSLSQDPKHRVFMPLTRAAYKVIYEGMDPTLAVRGLLLRNS